jgi:DNA-binding transcriptional LysR family regulator
MKLDLRQLRHLLALDRHRNFARAAEAVGLTQSALSRSLQSLEDEFGARLFDRDRTRVEPTAVGARLIELAAPLLLQARLAERELERMIGVADGLLRIGVGPYASEISVGAALGRMASQHPGLRADVSVADWPDLYDRLLANDLDVVVAETSHAVEDNRFAVDPLPTHQAFFYCRPGHPLAGRADVTLREVVAYPIAMTYLPRRLVALGESTRSLHGMSLPEGVNVTQFRIDTPYLARRAVMNSDMLGIAVPAQIELELAVGSLKLLPLRLLWLKTSYGVIQLARRTPSPALSEFLRVLREVEGEIDDPPIRARQ